MDLHNRSVYLLYDGDSYEIIVDSTNRIVELWRYDGNKNSKPHFCVLEHLDEILQDRIHDKVSK